VRACPLVVRGCEMASDNNNSQARPNLRDRAVQFPSGGMQQPVPCRTWFHRRSDGSQSQLGVPKDNLYH
jgi:hypothetical protein